MPSTLAPSDPAAAIVFDGRSARPWPARLYRAPDGLIVEVDGEREAIPLGLLRRGSDGAGSRTLFHRADRPDWRAVSDAPVPSDWLVGIAPLHRPSRGKMLGGVMAVAATLLAIGGLWLHGGSLLTWAAPLVPHRVTSAVGHAVIQQMSDRTRRCHAPAGRAALDRMVTRLRPVGGFVEPLDVTVFADPAVNAFAAPGGQIVVFSGLIDAAESADEVAGVLAHEIAHVQLRHPTKALIRHAGLSLAAQSLGGNVGGLADLAILLHRTRGAEADADAEAIRLMAGARVSPHGLARFFARLRSAEGSASEDDNSALLKRLADYAATHPSDESRRAAMADAASRSVATSPAASPADWQALRSICSR